jgi:hypothetical protein
MNEETEVKYETVYKFKNQNESDDFYIAMQWPEDKEKAKKLVAPTNLTELVI